MGGRVFDQREGRRGDASRGNPDNRLNLGLSRCCCVVLCLVNLMSPLTTHQIGQKLVEASRNEEDSLPLSTKLFPYLFVASRKMSLRRMSGWLLEKHGVSLSAAAISRALNSPELHLERLADSYAPLIRNVATAYGCQPLNLVFGERFENGPSELAWLALDHKQPEDEHDVERWGDLHALAHSWESIPHEVCLMLEPYLNEMLGDDEFEPGENSDV